MTGDAGIAGEVPSRRCAAQTDVVMIPGMYYNDTDYGLLEKAQADMNRRNIQLTGTGENSTELQCCLAFLR